MLLPPASVWRDQRTSIGGLRLSREPGPASGTLRQTEGEGGRLGAIQLGEDDRYGPAVVRGSMFVGAYLVEREATASGPLACESRSATSFTRTAKRFRRRHNLMSS